MKNNKLMKMGGVFLAAAVMFTGVWAVEQNTGEDVTAIPQIVEYVDTADGSVIVLEEDVPLASKPIVKKKTTTKKSVQKKKLSAKAKKTKKKTTRKTTKKTTNQESSTQKIKTDTTVLTTVQAATKKNSKIETVTTTVKTTVQTTTTNKPKTTTTTVKTASAPTSTAASKNTAASDTKISTVSTVSIRNIASKADENVLAAYELMGFTTEINPTVSYAGYFGVQAHKIILQEKNGTAVYHELGHFLGWLAGNVDLKPEFITIYNNEKSRLTGSNSAYLTKNSSEYFAESYREYVLNKAALKSSRPQTYAYIESSLAKITTARATTIKAAYQNSYWA